MKRRFLIAIALVACSAFAFGTARDGTCGATTTSCSFTATATNDLKIVFAYHATAATIPTLPGSWTSIATGTFSTLGGFQIACNKSSSSGDTSSGVWTNATLVVGISLSGTGVGTTANCNTTGIGGKGGNSGTSTSFNLPTITFTNGTDWAAGFGGSNANNVCAPTGMTSEIAVGLTTNPHGIGMDTEAAVSGWSSTTCTVTNGTWMSYVVEILNGSAAVPAFDKRRKLSRLGVPN